MARDTIDAPQAEPAAPSAAAGDRPATRPAGDDTVSLPAAGHLQVALTTGISLEAVAIPDGGAEHAAAEQDAAVGPPRTVTMALRGRRGAAFLIVEGVTPPLSRAFAESFCRALEHDRGTPASRLLRALRAACHTVEGRAVHRHALAALGATALLIDASHGTHAYFTQLPPCQAYVSDSEGVRAIPPEQLQRASSIASASGRRWEVELEVSRLLVQPGAAFLLCDAALAEDLSLSRLADALAQSPHSAAASILRVVGRGATGDSHAAIAIQMGRPPAGARSRLVHAGEAAALTAAARGRSTRASTPVAPSKGYRIEAWGVDRDRRGRGPLAGAMGRVLGPSITVYPQDRRANWPLRLAAAAVLLVLAGALGWRLLPQVKSRLPLPAGQAPTLTAVAVPALPPAPPLSGTALVVGASPLISLAPAGSGAAPWLFVADLSAGLLTIDSVGGAPPQPLDVRERPPAGPGWLAPREEDVLWLGADRSLRAVSVTGDVRDVPLRGSAAWQRPVAISSYAGNLYVLDAGTPGQSGGQVWRHAGTTGGAFDSDPQPWLQAGAGADLNGARGMAIDGSIWVARGDAGLLRLTAGRPDPFRLAAGTPPEAQIVSAGAVYTEFGFRSVYVVDASTRRLLQFSKDGRFERQVPDVFPTGEHPVGLWVEEASGRALVLTTARLQQVQIPR